MVLDLTGFDAFTLGARLLPFIPLFLIWILCNLFDPAPDLLVIASFLPATLAFCCRFFLILADFCGSVFIKQVDGLATILPFLGPDVHLKPCPGLPPFFLLKIWLTPSAIAEWSGCDSISLSTGVVPSN